MPTASDPGVQHRESARALIAGGRAPLAPWGWSALTAAAGGLVPGTVTVIGASTATGKTAFGLNIADHLAGQRLPFLAITTEIQAPLWLTWWAALRAGLSRRRLADPQHPLSDADRRELRRELDEWITQRGDVCRVEDGMRLTIGDVLRRLEAPAPGKTWVPEERPRVLLLDHLHQLDFPGHDLRRAVGDAMIRAKEAAESLGVAVILFAQLARAKDQRPRIAPWLVPSVSDLKESSAIEQVADVVLMLSRATKPNSRAAQTAYSRGDTGVPVSSFDDRGRMLVHLVKHRHDYPHATVNLYFDLGHGDRLHQTDPRPPAYDR